MIRITNALLYRLDHRGRIGLNIEGEQRASLTVNDLLQKYKDGVGKNLDTDRILLS